MAAGGTIAASAPAPTSPSCTGGGGGDTSDARSLWLGPADDVQGRASVLDREGVLVPGFPWDHDTHAENLLTLRRDPGDGQGGTATFRGTHAGELRELQLDLFRGTPNHDAPVDAFHVAITYGEVEAFSGDVAFDYTGDELMRLCQVTNGWYGARIVGLAGLVPATDEPAELVVTIALASTAAPGQAEVLGMAEADQPSRVVVNPDPDGFGSPRTDARGA